MPLITPEVRAVNNFSRSDPNFRENSDYFFFFFFLNHGKKKNSGNKLKPVIKSKHKSPPDKRETKQNPTGARHGEAPLTELMAVICLFRTARKLRLSFAPLSFFHVSSSSSSSSYLLNPKTLAQSPILPPAIHLRQLHYLISPPPSNSGILHGFLPHALSLVSSYSSGVREKEGDEEAPPKPVQSWVDAYLPEMVRPYALLARLDKPIGTWLLAWPCMWYFFFLASNSYMKYK